MARDDQAIIFRPGDEAYAAIKAGLERTGLPEGRAITQILLAAFGENELLEQLQRAQVYGAEIAPPPPKRRGAKK